VSSNPFRRKAIQDEVVATSSAEVKSGKQSTIDKLTTSESRRRIGRFGNEQEALRYGKGSGASRS